MFRERYYKSFPVRMKIIAYNAIIIFCHLIEFAVFAVRDFLSLFSIAVFNIPISHIIVFFVVSDAKIQPFSLFTNFFLTFFIFGV